MGPSNNSRITGRSYGTSKAQRNTRTTQAGISALRLGSEIAQEPDFQYIMTTNEDDAFKETIEGFDLNDDVLPTRLTDATEDGGLFGIRFG